MAFLITGLQIRQIFDELNKSWNYLALAVGGAGRLHPDPARLGADLHDRHPLAHQDGVAPWRARKLRQITPQTALVVGWAGMRGIVTLGTALALPADFPQRDVIQFTAFAVVLGTLGFQGLTLKPLIAWLTLPGGHE